MLSIKPEHKLMVALIILAVATLTLIGLSISNHNHKKLYIQEVALNQALADDMLTWKDKDGRNRSKIMVLETEKTKYFTALQTKDEEVIRLQQLVREYESKLKQQGSATVIETQIEYVKVPTPYFPIGGDSIVFSQSVLVDTVRNDWVNAIYGFDKGNSVFKLRTRDVIGVVIGEERVGLFKTKPVVEVVNYNPYSATTSLRSYRVTMPVQKKWGIGLTGGFGAVYDIKKQTLGYGPFIGASVNYNLFEW